MIWKVYGICSMGLVWSTIRCHAAPRNEKCFSADRVKYLCTKYTRWASPTRSLIQGRDKSAPIEALRQAKI